MLYDSHSSHRLASWPAAAIVAILLAGEFSGGPSVHACNVPVFRFALERWQADSYRATVYHRGPLTDEQKAMLATLEGPSGKVTGNFVVRTVDVEQPMGEADQQLLASQAAAELPRLVVRYPEHLRIEVPVWSAPLERESITRLTESPVRNELIRRLTEGQTAVWLMLETGSPETDDATAALIETELKKLEKFLSLPELTDEPTDSLLTTVPLQVAFSLIRVPRNDPREQALVGMLLRAEPDLMERNDPLAFPVFGRGRALLPLVGPGITAKNIHESAAFLVGPCSCEIKELNPGFDLLLAAAWDELIYDGAAPPQLLASAPVDISAEPVLVPIPSGSSLVAQSASSDHVTGPAAAPALAHAGSAAASATALPPVSSGQSQTVLLIVAGMVVATMLVIGYGYP